MLVKHMIPEIPLIVKFAFAADYMALDRSLTPLRYTSAWELHLSLLLITGNLISNIGSANALRGPSGEG